MRFALLHRACSLAATRTQKGLALGGLGRRCCATAPTEAAVKPTRLQLRRLFVTAAVPFVAFGIVDQTVLLYAGDAIDNTMGVKFGLPTLAAAACGQVLSDTCGVTFGGTIEAMALKLGLQLPGLTDAQKRMGITTRIATLGGVCGVIVGCLIGMLNLLVIDLGAAERAKKEKALSTIMKTVMESGKSVLECSRATLWAVDEEKQELWSSIREHQEKNVGNIIRVPLTSTSIAGWVAQNNEGVNIPDVTKDPRWSKGVKFADGFELRSMLCAPVVLEGKVVAVIQLMNKNDKDGNSCAFLKEDVKLIGMLAHHTALFMEQLS
ncbi:unnamed protein product [Polarella glacialis]|uniref:GAF domain-containing protein n=1 Tax=Polarella glacialis TaxID=89957 RepID=A0A813G1M1_POLGL|nr:unnamed protein product [Polarella glacialis]|eukprot:CAMPEP_0115065676 /NCGR_PEP_ID=MMETSP0227-20121206/10388_1 /TAXON_ID=89957 /ORGANISM="Polarella glacialis, Strain CCMP 1383" /LENGTH=321 /DNA_ID=CAMNT_0002451501 /DNA_START=107 /DNA_END=1072 /DNA_ORIENTATION=+